MKPIVGSSTIYVVQMADAAHVMICTNVLIKKVLCMCFAGFLWVFYYCTMYYVCVLLVYVEVMYRVTEWTNTDN